MSKDRFGDLGGAAAGGGGVAERAIRSSPNSIAVCASFILASTNSRSNCSDRATASLDRSSLDSERSVAEDAEPAPPPTTLGDLPPELAAHVLSLAAPRCPLYRAVEDAVAEANARGAADLALAIQTGNDGEAH